MESFLFANDKRLFVSLEGVIHHDQKYHLNRATLGQQNICHVCFQFSVATQIHSWRGGFAWAEQYHRYHGGHE